MRHLAFGRFTLSITAYLFSRVLTVPQFTKKFENVQAYGSAWKLPRYHTWTGPEIKYAISFSNTFSRTQKRRVTGHHFDLWARTCFCLRTHFRALSESQDSTEMRVRASSVLLFTSSFSSTSSSCRFSSWRSSFSSTSSLTWP